MTDKPRKKPSELRSQQWFGRQDRDGFAYRSWVKGKGVLLMGCDKTTPSLVMGASSVNLPTIGVSGGPMLNGKWRGQELGSGTGVWSMSEQVRAGTLKLQDFFEAESCMHRSHGHCMTMGTASTMASMV